MILAIKLSLAKYKGNTFLIVLALCDLCLSFKIKVSKRLKAIIDYELLWEISSVSFLFIFSISFNSFLRAAEFFGRFICFNSHKFSSRNVHHTFCVGGFSDYSELNMWSKTQWQWTSSKVYIFYVFLYIIIALPLFWFLKHDLEVKLTQAFQTVREK